MYGIMKGDRLVECRITIVDISLLQLSLYSHGDSTIVKQVRASIEKYSLNL